MKSYTFARKRLGLECPELLSETELSALQETMLLSLHIFRELPH
jgi:hypothetical protein